jgi:hypothetical protein
MIDSSHGVGYIAVDVESRRPINEYSDAGIRIVGASGLVVNYKRLLTDTESPVLVSIMPGVGFVNLGQHVHFETTLLVSASNSGFADADMRFLPYGGVRVIQVAPLNNTAVHDTPTAGGFSAYASGAPSWG